MRTVVLGERPAELEALIARRRALGQDRLDEVWDGEYHMAAAPTFFHSIVAGDLLTLLRQRAAARGLLVGTEFNLGRGEHNFRVPDLGVHRELVDRDWVPTAAMVVEVVSPDDESWLKFDHYAAHGVDEVLIADPRERTLDLFVLAGDHYARAERSALLDVSVAELHEAVAWPGSQ